MPEGPRHQIIGLAPCQAVAKRGGRGHCVRPYGTIATQGQAQGQENPAWIAHKPLIWRGQPPALPQDKRPSPVSPHLA